MTTLNDDTNVIDLNLPGLGPDTIFAGGGADFVRTSTLGGSLIFGQGDNDTLISVGPNDTIYGGADEDSIRSQRTPALLFGDGGSDTIIAEARATMQGGEGDDFLQGTVEANVIYGNQGSDTILGGAQRRDTIYGGKGNDAVGFFIAGGGNNLGLPLSGVGFAGNEGSNFLRGDSGDDLVAGINIRDSLFGGKGNDTLRGAGSSSYLEGGEDNDTLFVANTTQTSPFASGFITIGIERTTLLGGAGNDSLQGSIGEFGGGRNLLDAGDGNDTIRVFSTQDTAIGGAGDDFIVSATVTALSSGGAQSSLPGFAGRNFLDGGTGNDTIVAAFSTDTMIGGDGSDSLSGIFTNASGADGDDTINASLSNVNGRITLDGGIGNDLLIGNTNVSTSFTTTHVMNGGAGNDTVIFGNASDTLVGDSAGNDFISYASSVNFTGRTTVNRITDNQGSNLIFGANGTDVITTGSGNDTLFGGPANLITPGNDGDDTLDAGGGNDVLLGGFGNDYLLGGDGDDSLGGGPGADTLIGGTGNDSFYYNNFGEGVPIGGAPNFLPTGSNPDQIGDFVSGQDKLVFQQTGFSALNPFPDTNRLSSGSLLVLETGAYSSSFGPAGAATNQGFLFYQAEDGRLGYDPDGTAGANPGVTLAILNNKPGLSASDITLI